ncbi:SCO2525 family SAM-dependent methyltransferase [Phytohabitans sp. ZYX-F-186]|uniref:SCO2525 family SAM-dependent methyltransferase n=1 Tax=Phytohabitans maris TaxID=3071409 RepID=A0ABU0ZB41_9ACTN|nr:SCO2525 family SAM-dependent methyltransferase [Phytohabitans sp. ZYX-F-186]MDQ7904272.1 SCO2525 family SAM-dependent methyltransferase [Phytohabitans sp. ZYX-F-186]
MATEAPQFTQRRAAPKISEAVRNQDVNWDLFDSSAYWEANYKSLRDDDQQILSIMEDFFTQLPPESRAKGVDVGPGANLYPALAMLPFCEEIVLWEHSAANVRWLRGELRSFRSTWDPFWRLVTRARRSWFGEEVPEGAIDPRSMLARVAEVRQGSVFDLPEAAFDVGTMFFVAESLTEDPKEFELATKRFVASLKPGAPFAAAFMEQSGGYDVGGYRFPAVPITIEDVEKCLQDIVDKPQVQPVASQKPLREGYSGGMILALGRAGK